MKTSMLGCSGLVLLLLAGCASSGGNRYASEEKFVVDKAYVAAVERTARDRGVRVQWVNPPTKRVAAVSSNEG